MCFIPGLKSDETNTQKIISHFRHISHSIQPRHRLQQLRMMFEEDPMATVNEIGRHIDRPIEQLLCSLWICQLKDDDKAALDGVPLTLDTHVEDGFTHAESISLHLRMIFLTMPKNSSSKAFNLALIGWLGSGGDLLVFKP